MERKGLVIEGGGMKCAYSAGILDCFIDQNINFNYCIGVSAGSANAASFLAKQKGRNLRFYTIHSKDKQYLSIQNYLLTGQVFGLQHIYGDMSNTGGIDPLDYETMSQNPCEYEAVATEGSTGKPVYFGKSELRKDDYRIIMASSALPVFCKPIEIDGKEYFDGGVTDAIPAKRAMAKGCQKIVVLLSKPRSFFKQPEKHKLIYTEKLKEYPGLVKALDQRHIMYRNQIAYLQYLEAIGKAFVFAPSESIEMSTFTKDPAIEQQLYDLGVKDYWSNAKKLNDFLISDKN